MEKRTWIRVDCNTDPTSQEEESSNSEAEENIITDNWISCGGRQ